MIRAELLKLTTVTGTWVAVGIGAAGLLLTQLLAVTFIPALASGDVRGVPAQSELGAVDPGSLEFQAAALNPLGSVLGSTGSIGVATIVVMVLGLLVATTDYRFGGLVTTALAQPRRLRILGGKITATAIAAAALAVVFVVICLATLLITAAALPSIEFVVPVAQVLGIAARSVAVIVLLALLGVAIGVLVRSQLAGVLVVIALLVLEPIVQSIAQLVTGTVPVWAQLLPLSLGQAAIADSASSVFPAIIALPALAAIVIVVTTASGTVLRRRDL